MATAIVPTQRKRWNQTGLDLVAEYLKAVSAKRSEDDFIYRGHASNVWEIKPSGMRDDAAGIVTKNQMRAWKALAQRFVTPRPTNDLEYLVLAQHYGIPTALLDWTSNPLVALFFACQPETGFPDGEVLQVRRSSFEPIDKMETVGIYRVRRKAPLLLDTSASNVRSAAQDSFMTLHTAKDAVVPGEPVYTVNGRHKIAILDALQHFGITAARVYADLGTAAQQFRQNLLDQKDMLELGLVSEPDENDPDDEILGV